MPRSSQANVIKQALLESPPLLQRIPSMRAFVEPLVGFTPNDIEAIYAIASDLD